MTYSTNLPTRQEFKNTMTALEFIDRVCEAESDLYLNEDIVLTNKENLTHFCLDTIDKLMKIFDDFENGYLLSFCYCDNYGREEDSRIKSVDELYDLLTKED